MILSSFTSILSIYFIILCNLQRLIKHIGWVQKQEYTNMKCENNFQLSSSFEMNDSALLKVNKMHKNVNNNNINNSNTY